MECQISLCERIKKHKPLIDWSVVRLPRTIIKTDHKFLLSYLTTQYKNPSWTYTWKRSGNAEHKQVLLLFCTFYFNFPYASVIFLYSSMGEKKLTDRNDRKPSASNSTSVLHSFLAHKHGQSGTIQLTSRFSVNQTHSSANKPVCWIFQSASPHSTLGVTMFSLK